MIFNNPREKYVLAIITLMGWFLVGMALSTGNPAWYLIFMGPLFALAPVIVAWIKFIEWVEERKIDEKM